MRLDIHEQFDELAIELGGIDFRTAVSLGLVLGERPTVAVSRNGNTVERLGHEESQLITAIFRHFLAILGVGELVVQQQVTGVVLLVEDLTGNIDGTGHADGSLHVGTDRVVFKDNLVEFTCQNATKLVLQRCLRTVVVRNFPIQSLDITFVNHGC